MTTWREQKISNAGEDYRNLYTPRADEDLPYIGLEHIQQGALQLSGIGKSCEVISAKKAFKRNDILFGTLRPYFRKVVKPDFSGVCSTDIAVIRARTGFDQTFLFYLISSQPIIDYASVIANGTKMPRAKWDIIGRESFLLPDYPSQQKIGGVLAAYDKLLENNSRRILLLEKMAEDIFREWFVRLRFPGHKGTKVVRGVPTGWEIIEASKLIQEVVRGRSYAGEEINEIGEGIPFINLKSINRGGGYREDGLKYYTGSYEELQLLNPGDITMAVTDMTQDRAVVGRVARAPYGEHPKYLISSDLVKLLPNPKINNLILYTYLRYSSFSESLKEFANGANVLHLRPGLIQKQKVLFPGWELLNLYGEQIAPLYEAINHLSPTILRLQTSRERLLTRLMNGKIDVENLDIKFPPVMTDEKEVVHA
jgi:type I restriction enzyme S subunit